MGTNRKRYSIEFAVVGVLFALPAQFLFGIKQIAYPAGAVLVTANKDQGKNPAKGQASDGEGT